MPEEETKAVMRLSKTDIELREEYLRMLRLPYTSSERLSGQTRMCILRDAIARQERRDPESVQAEYEQRAGHGPAPEPLPIAFERAYAENEGEPVADVTQETWLAKALRGEHSAPPRDAEGSRIALTVVSLRENADKLSHDAARTIERLQRELDEARAEKAERREFWEAHRDHFDVAGNYIPHSQLDGDLRAAEASLVRAREALKEAAETLRQPDHRHRSEEWVLSLIEDALGDAP